VLGGYAMVCENHPPRRSPQPDRGHQLVIDDGTILRRREISAIEFGARDAMVVEPLPNALRVTVPYEVVRGLVIASLHFPDHSAMHCHMLRHRPERAAA
jgi:hypothetical protein